MAQGVKHQVVRKVAYAMPCRRILPPDQNGNAAMHQSGDLQHHSTDGADLLHANDMLCPKPCENGREEGLVEQAGVGMMSS